MAKLQKLDELTLRDHPFLQDDDLCYYFGEYTGGGQGFAYSNFNSLILNFKKDPSKEGTFEWDYKLGAIETIATGFVDIFKKISRIQHITLVPIPPSKMKNNPKYDDRILKMLRRVEEKLGKKLDIRELIISRQDREPLHKGETRLTPPELRKYLEFNRDVFDPVPQEILLIDDVLTNGTHFRAMKDMITQEFPAVRVTGLFISRRIFPFVDSLLD